MTNPIITLRNRATRLHYLAESNNLLEALEQHQIAVEYQCRSGYCGSCRMQLLKGEVCYSTQPLAFIQDGDILPCCCMPLGDIEIEF